MSLNVKLWLIITILFGQFRYICPALGLNHLKNQGNQDSAFVQKKGPLSTAQEERCCNLVKQEMLAFDQLYHACTASLLLLQEEYLNNMRRQDEMRCLYRKSMHPELPVCDKVYCSDCGACILLETFADGTPNQLATGCQCRFAERVQPVVDSKEASIAQGSMQRYHNGWRVRNLQWQQFVTSTVPVQKRRRHKNRIVTSLQPCLENSDIYR